MEKEQQLSRGDLLAKLALAPIAIGALAMIRAEADAAATHDAVSGGTMAPQAAAYQTTPKGAAKCSNCSLYIPAKSNPAKSNGACKIVKGAISPHGWCKFYSKKA